jgi:ABC-2 type transport system ATP-binding protein
VLDHVNLDIRQGETFGLLGPNGAGKTTTMRVALGLIRPSAGEVRIFDRPAHEWEARKRVGFLPEAPYLHDHLTAEGCLRFFGQLCEMDGIVLVRRVDTLLELVGLAHARSRRLRTFSKGMLQRVAIAQALINDPDLLLLDEPMSGLDPVGRREMRHVLLRLKQQGKTIVMNSHLLHDVEVLCDRVAILRHGRVAAVTEVWKYADGETAGGERRESPVGQQEEAGTGCSLEDLYCRVVTEGREVAV